MRESMAVLAFVALLAGACASPSDLAAGDEPIELTVTREADTASLSCGDASEGTAWLSGDAADAACQQVRAATGRLIDGGGPPGDVCTQQYGGPERATVTGEIEGSAVDASFHRADGCGISDWETWADVLGEPGGLRSVEG